MGFYYGDQLYANVWRLISACDSMCIDRALMRAARWGNVQCVHRLIDANAESDLRDKRQSTR